ncbi:MAG: exodeoxyribonuclease VII small subunit [Lachnospiraceae bacterium]|nr:exodeoxyribonuclease VII small subunit [Lachnospiraceae bacterium]
MNKKKELSIEESFAKLDEMIKNLESDTITLEESFRVYEEGMKMVKDVSGRIDLVEKKMQVLMEDGQKTDFTGEKDEL